MKRLIFFCLLIATLNFASAADPMDEFANLQTQWEETLLDAYGARLDDAAWQNLRRSTADFSRYFASANSRRMWAEAMTQTWVGGERTNIQTAVAAGKWRAVFEQVLALETLAQQRAGNVAGAQQWRALLDLPKHANAIDGALALQRLGAQESERNAVSELLSREFVSWATTRVQEKLDDL